MRHHRLLAGVLPLALAAQEAPDCAAAAALAPEGVTITAAAADATPHPIACSVAR